MTIFNVNPDDFYRFTVDTEPSRQFSRKINSDQPEETGNVTLFDRRGSVEKRMPDRLRGVSLIPVSENRSLTDNLILYIDEIKRNQNLLNTKSFSIKRITPNQLTHPSIINDRFPSPTSQEEGRPRLNNLDSTRLDESVQKKWIIKDILDPHYGYTADAWEYPNFHSLNFLGGGCLVYPNVGGRYNLQKEFSIDFHIKVNHDLAERGTILHIPRVLCLFVSPGTERDLNGETSSYKLELKIWEDINKPENDFIESLGGFVESDNNCLKRNTWHRVVVRRDKGGNIAFIVDGLKSGEEENIPIFWEFNNLSYPKVFSIGSFLNEPKTKYDNLFTRGSSELFGVEKIIDGSTVENVTNFSNPLFAEIHNFCIHRSFLKDNQINDTSQKPSLNRSTIFFLPPFFNEESGFRRASSLHKSGIIRHPFIPFNNSLINGSTYEPINVFCSFGAGGHLVNIENFLSDFSNIENGEDPEKFRFSRPRFFGFYPGIYSRNPDKTSDMVFDSFISIKKRNLLILPCDDGKFKPFDIPKDDYKNIFSFINDNKNINLEWENYSKNNRSNLELPNDENVFSGGTKPFPGKNYGSLSELWRILISDINSEPLFLETKKTFPLYYPTIFKDWTSNQIVIFEIPNLFYGKTIKPGTIQIKDSNVKGLYPLTIRDDGLGSLYRADCIGEHAKWNSVGRVFYSEGLIVIKNPHLYPLGEGGFEISFKGDHSIHTLKVEVIAPQNTLNTSVNPSFKSFDSKLSPTPDPSDEGSEFVWISGLNFHDENFNIVAKTHLAQPVMKRHKDRILFRVQMDF